MGKNRLGKGSYHAQDAQLDEYLPEIQEAVGSQPTRPVIHHMQSNKSAKDGLRKK